MQVAAASRRRHPHPFLKSRKGAGRAPGAPPSLTTHTGTGLPLVTLQERIAAVDRRFAFVVGVGTHAESESAAAGCVRALQAGRAEEPADDGLCGAHRGGGPTGCGAGAGTAGGKVAHAVAGRGADVVVGQVDEARALRRVVGAVRLVLVDVEVTGRVAAVVVAPPVVALPGE